MSSFTIIGTGNMGSAIGGVLAAGGNDVVHVSHDKLATAAIDTDAVILAVPYGAIAEILSTVGDRLAGKVVVDISNPLNFETFDSLLVPADSSAAAELQAKLPDSSVVKAFNTNFAATLSAAQLGGVATTVLVAGDDDAAKNVLISAVTAGGVAALDAGSLSRARELEAIGFLQLTLAVSEKVGWNAGFAVIR
ncbi:MULTISPECIES: NADPH-dependent F420 reductase [Microbacterium]|uniref:NADPH-dependent F420 reductase n=1 Tax=Microbacterium TaxID=33882 RepID=UPI00278080FF|nr:MULTISPECIES: NADPH-dependent F420 reductase [Microbacterium]MDQ1075378.1 putative dinucleotide-binding enzyme [Microbacterium sp. SORGH_AS_0969]MDQ1115608.1 putative dinucleotide-binding enzyme [Microbacterium testaceum]